MRHELVKGMPDSVYHADPTDEIALSHSVATVLCAQSPLHAALEHPKLNGGRRTVRDEQAQQRMDRGSVVHALILGTEMHHVVEVEADSFRAKEAREARDDARRRGLVPVLSHKLEQYRYAAGELKGKIEARLQAVFSCGLCGDSEVSMFWESGGVQCKGRIDHFLSGQAYDLKCGDANPVGLGKSFVAMGWDIQDAAYTEGIERFYTHLAGRVPPLLFIRAEVEPPFAVTLARCDGMMRELGRAKWEHAKRQWRRCVQSGEWPEYQDGSEVEMVSPPNWAAEGWL